MIIKTDNLDGLGAEWEARWNNYKNSKEFQDYEVDRIWHDLKYGADHFYNDQSLLQHYLRWRKNEETTHA
ncbi:MAG: hypothetical protein DRQ40_06290 [Gammaproteobacteria bacterium]|nr:MAG: hypothetical protein DRQ40_06290 [Gammaproteobacteria bacterium]